MEQSAKLYRINNTNFSLLEDNPETYKLSEIGEGYETFEGSYEGLRYVLSKTVNEDKVGMVWQIFYPLTFIGEEVDIADLDLDTLPDDFDFDGSAIYYHDPESVANVADFLERTSIDQFKKLFNPEELNSEDIYPEGAWNTETAEDSLFNERHMVEEFNNLKQLFLTACKAGEYIVCVIE